MIFFQNNEQEKKKKKPMVLYTPKLVRREIYKQEPVYTP